MLPYPTAELTWGLILSLVRNIPREERNMRTGGWQTTVGVGLKGKTLGVFGLGNLGSQVARIGKAFGMEAVAWSQNLTAERAASVGASLVSKEELFRRADIVTIHLVLSERTRGAVAAAELALMKPEAYLVNTSRGPIVDTAALIAALERRRLAGAGTRRLRQRAAAGRPPAAQARQCGADAAPRLRDRRRLPAGLW